MRARRGRYWHGRRPSKPDRRSQRYKLQEYRPSDDCEDDKRWRIGWTDIDRPVAPPGFLEPRRRKGVDVREYHQGQEVVRERFFGKFEILTC